MEATKKPTPSAIIATSSMAATYELILSRARPMAPNPRQD
jgi:hypothetical protein